MDQQQKETYKKLIQYVEEPIRGVVRALWDISFIEDSGHCCCGHMVQYGKPLTAENFSKAWWYPHEPMLEIFYSFDEKSIAERDRFREAVKGATGTYGGRQLHFNDILTREVQGYEQERICGKKSKEWALCERYIADFEEGEKTIENVLVTEALFAAFWEDVAKAVQQFNQGAYMEKIKGNFRKPITLDHWKNFFPERFK